MEHLFESVVSNLLSRELLMTNFFNEESIVVKRDLKAIEEGKFILKEFKEDDEDGNYEEES